MSPWTVHGSGPQTYYRRPLGVTEQVFYWDGQFEGTADSAHVAEVEIKQGDHASLLSKYNVERAWISLKSQYPLVGARVQRHEDGSLYFAIDENDLDSCGPMEVNYHTIGSAEEAIAIATDLPNSPRILSDTLLSCLFLFYRTDNRDRFHILIYSAHSISDGIANATLQRTFLDNLARAQAPVHTWEIRERLALSLSSEELFPVRNSNAARRRWRRAIGAVIHARRAPRVSGGHSLPKRVTKLTPYQPAHSRNISRRFTKEETFSITQACRNLGVTFGVALPVLGQVAIARVLCRRYVRGEIDEEEWEFRKKEPMINGGPLNLRPYLDKEWFNRGGASNVSLSVGFFSYILPCMPLGTAANIKPGSSVPSYSNLMSRERFRLRCENIKKQAALIFQHPLLCEINLARLQGRAQMLKDIAEIWKRKSILHDSTERRVMSASEQAATGVVYGHGGSSFGYTDSLYPRTYPLSGAEPVLELISGKTVLNCRPGELYLGASTGRQQLTLTVFFDGNCYETDVVEEWVGEVVNAIEHFLIGRKSVSSHL